MTKIDSINTKILKDLLKDGRKSFTEIAKECNKSTDFIAKRFKRMKSEGIIVGATIQNSCACLGCSFSASINIDTEPKETERVLQLVRRTLPNSAAVYPECARPNIVAMVPLKSVEELGKAKQSIMKLPFVLKVDTIVWTGIRNTPENLSVLALQETNTKNENISVKTKSSRGRRANKIDEIDIQIIEKLAKNGRIPFKKIAAELKLSADTVIRRYKKLKENGDLKAVIQINPTKIGYDAFAIFKLTSFCKDDLVCLEAFAKIPDVNFVIKTSGSFDFMISLMIRDTKQFIAIQEEITHMPCVANMEATLSKMFSPWPLTRELISTV